MNEVYHVSENKERQTTAEKLKGTHVKKRRQSEP